MNSVKILVLAILLIPTTAYASQVYGSLKKDGEPVRGAKVEIACGNNTYPGETDAYGSYSINVREKGKCTIRVHHDNQILEHPVYSYDDPVRYDFDLTRNGGGYVLKRR